MAKSKRLADAAPASSKRSRKSAASAPDKAAADGQQQQELQAAAPSTSRRRKPTATAAAAAADAGADASSKKPRQGRGAKAGSTSKATAAPAAAAAAADKPAAKRKSAAAAAAAAAASEPAAAPEKPAAKVKCADKPKPPYYLVKSEPDEFSIEMLKQRPNQTEGWEGVRNYVARNHMRAMKLGDRAFFYHSSCKVPGIVGIVEVVRESYPDMTARDKSSKYHDPKDSGDEPRWSMVDFKLVRELKRQITLDELKQHKTGPLASMALFTTARLSVQPVSKEEWEFVLSLEDT